MTANRKPTPKLTVAVLSDIARVITNNPDAAYKGAVVNVVYDPNGVSVDWWFDFGTARLHAKQIGGFVHKMEIADPRS